VRAQCIFLLLCVGHSLAIAAVCFPRLAVSVWQKRECPVNGSLYPASVQPHHSFETATKLIECCIGKEAEYRALEEP
jgi:hypothetical protein